MSFFINHTATPDIYTLSLHDVFRSPSTGRVFELEEQRFNRCVVEKRCSSRDRKSTRLNSSHGSISYAVFCLKKNKNTEILVSKKRIRTNTERSEKETNVKITLSEEM